MLDRFRKRLQAIRSDAEKKRDLAAREQAEKVQRERENRRRVDEVADAIERHIESCLEAFLGEFVEFRFEASTRDGRQIRVYWDEPTTDASGREDKLFHQLHFHVRRYHEYSDVEVVAKAIVRNRDRRRRAHEEDVWEGDPSRLEPFVEEEIVAFTRLYGGAD